MMSPTDTATRFAEVIQLLDTDVLLAIASGKLNALQVLKGELLSRGISGTATVLPPAFFSFSDDVVVGEIVEDMNSYIYEEDFEPWEAEIISMEGSYIGRDEDGARLYKLSGGQVIRLV